MMHRVSLMHRESLVLFERVLVGERHGLSGKIGALPLSAAET